MMPVRGARVIAPNTLQGPQGCAAAFWFYYSRPATHHHQSVVRSTERRGAWVLFRHFTSYFLAAAPRHELCFFLHTHGRATDKTPAANTLIMTSPSGSTDRVARIRCVCKNFPKRQKLHSPFQLTDSLG
jgi:hypothetical protein